LIAAQAQDLYFQRGPGFALRIERWAVPSGDRIALTGPSGGGKSTLLSLLSGELAAASGSLVVCGQELVGAPEPTRRRHRLQNTGLILQDGALLSHLSLLDNVLLPCRLDPGCAVDRATRAKAQALLDQVGLGDRASDRPDRLSQGERHRVGLARALLRDPPLLLADEPTAGLDPDRARDLLDLLDARVVQGRTLVLVSHDPLVLDRFPVVLDIRQWRVSS
jgi:putative ABC transport system ATP-binding protein